MIHLFGNSTTKGQRQRRFSRHPLLILILHSALMGGFFLVNGSVTAQTRDHLTDQETELVRFYQELDKRIDVFIKAIDRRFAIVNGATLPGVKKLVKDEPDWGELPKGTRAELLGDIAGILDEAITNLDDVSHRDPKNPLISRSLRKLTASTNAYLRQLTALKEQVKDPDEAAAIDHVADNAKQIIEVGAKLPAATPEADKKKKKP
jgi:hypothetical protein